MRTTTPIRWFSNRNASALPPPSVGMPR
ncbi:hypothetical protein IEO21_11086 [Rhodonia placenta]|uniref:Uncharacterized protein n=1 Tax=Rhodonia placenta TaxID=104341 RepID=A0A8H7NR85_9APHY|nr:hypothetical protein IEO21_11086 [Postia placenta]